MGTGSSVRGWMRSSPNIEGIPTVAYSAIRTRRGPASCSSRRGVADPPGERPVPDLAAVRFRARCVRVARTEGVAAVLALGASRASLHRWRVRYEHGGLDALFDHQRGPAPDRLPDWVEQAVIVVRLLTYWNSKRLAAEFTRREIFPLDHHAIDRLLGDLGTARPSSDASTAPPTSGGGPTSSGTSTSRGRSSCAGRRTSTRRPGSSAWSTTTAAS